MKRAVCLLVFSCLVLAGCMTPLPPMQDASEDVPRARLRAIADKTSVIEGASKGESRMELVRRGGANGRSLGMPNPERAEKQSFNEFYVEAGKPFVVSNSIQLSNGSCLVTGHFVPEEGKDYEIQAHWLSKVRWFSRSGNVAKCMLAVFVFENGQWSLTPITSGGAQ